MEYFKMVALRAYTISLGHGWTAMPQYLLNHEQSLATVHQERRELMSQIVYPQMR